MTENNITTSYVGKDSGAFISPVLLAGRTLGVPGVTIHNNVNYRSRITKIALSDLIKDATCDFDPSGTVDQTEVWLEVKPLEVNMELCKLDYLNDFIGQDMGCGDSLPADFLAYLMTQIGASVTDALEIMVWQGQDEANSFLGFEPRFDAQSVGTGSPVLLTADNIIAEIRRLVNANPSAAALVGKSDAYIYLSSQNFSLLQQANNDKGNAAPCGEDCISIDGIKTFLAPGKSSTRMAYALKSNLHFGTWNNSDMTSVSVKDMSEFLEKNIRFAMCFFGGTAVGNPNEVSYYLGNGAAPPVVVDGVSDGTPLAGAAAGSGQCDSVVSYSSGVGTGLMSYASDDEAVATVDLAGLVTFVAIGSAIITATSIEDGAFSGTTAVTVS
jgi:hypothetical protein